MSDTNLSAQLIRLQNALLEGKIDRATYEQLKKDLLDTARASKETFSSESRPPTDTDKSRDHRPSEAIEPPPENPFKKKMGMHQVLKTIKFQDLSQPPATSAETPPAAPERGSVTPNSPPQTRTMPLPGRDPRGTNSNQAPSTSSVTTSTRENAARLAGSRNASPHATGETAGSPTQAEQPANDRRGPVDDDESGHQESTSEILRQTFQDPETWAFVGEIAAHCFIVIGLRAWAIDRVTLFASIFAGFEVALIGGAGTLVWLLVNSVCRFIQDRDHEPLIRGLAHFGWTVLLLIAAAFWVLLGTMYGGLVGIIVGGRFGFLSEAGGSMVGGLIGLVKALQNYRNARLLVLEKRQFDPADDDD